MSRIVFEDDCQTEATRRLCWTWLGIPENHLDEMVAINAHWHLEREVLIVSHALQGSPGVVTRICNAVFFCMKWRDFSETRWAGVVPSARGWFLSEYVGVRYFVRSALQNPHVHNKHHLPGYDRLTFECRKYLAIATFAAVPVESFSISTSCSSIPSRL